MFNNFWLFEILTIQIEYFALRSPISGISFLTNLNKTSSFYYTNLMIFVLLLYFCIDHIDPYFICRTVQNLNKDNLRTYIIGGRGIKSVQKLLHFNLYTLLLYQSLCLRSPTVWDIIIIQLWYFLFMQSAGIIMLTLFISS